MSDGFIDLRQNQAQLVDEAFWPSFTDIMTVVVMIFLIATSILIVKNPFSRALASAGSTTLGLADYRR